MATQLGMWDATLYLKPSQPEGSSTQMLLADCATFTLQRRDKDKGLQDAPPWHTPIFHSSLPLLHFTLQLSPCIDNKLVNQLYARM